MGVETWNNGNLITINSSDASITLDNFESYRRTNINPLHKNDNAQLLAYVLSVLVGLLPVSGGHIVHLPRHRKQNIQ